MDNDFFEYFESQILPTIMEDIQMSLEQQVARKAIKVQRSKIQSEVYDKYKDPTTYIRRREKGLYGGATTKSVRSRNIWVAEISVYNKAIGKTGFRNLDWLIEYGHKKSGYKYDFPFNKTRTAKDFLQPRPFMKATYKEIKDKNIVQQSLKYALAQKGYKVRYY